MGFFKYFHFGLKRKYKYLFVGFIIALIVWNFLSAFGFCASEVDIITLDNASLSSSGVTSSESNSIGYSRLIKGHSYTFYNTSSSTNKYYAFSDVVPFVGLEVTRHTVTPNNTYTFTADRDVFIMGNNTNFYLVDNSVGMSSAVGSLITGLPSSDIWGVFGKSIPFILICILVAFGNYIINRNVDRISKGGSNDTYKRKGYYNKKKGYYYNPSASARAKARGKAKSS